MTRKTFIHSLSGRLLLIFAGVGALFLVLAGASIGSAFRAHFEAMLLPHVMQYLDYLRQDIGTPPDYRRAAEISRTLPVTLQIAGPEGVWASNGKPIDAARLESRHRGEVNGRVYDHGRLAGRDYLLIADGAYTFTYSVPHERNLTRIIVPLLVLSLILILLYYATRKLFAPIDTIKAGVERIGRGELDHRIQVRRCDELGDLAGSINAMADDVQQMLDSKRQLLLAISHELRSPLTRAKVATSLVDDDSQRKEIERELNDLEKLVEELLETERLATRHGLVHKQRVDLIDIIREVADHCRAQRKPSLHLPAAPVQAHADPMRIKLLLRNLLDNAYRHTLPQAPPPEIHIGEVREHDGTGEIPAHAPAWIEITVVDHGPGIAPEHLPRVTEPFYRADPARQRETGGYGLGLYLCRRIAEVHGGRLAVTSEPPDGTQVRVRLPM